MNAAQGTLVHSYDYGLVALSVFIAVLASYAALDLAGRVTSARGKSRTLWLTCGAIAMGIGIWSMHYIGMLAFLLPIPVQYDWPTVLVSLLAAILASAVALFVVSRNEMGTGSALVGSLFMGGGIATMHYTGMAAMRLPAMCGYRPWLVALSVVLAVVISLVALRLTFYFREDTRPWSPYKAICALVMGAAIPVMHYTGMAAATFTPSAIAQQDLAHAVNVSSLSVAGISIVTFMVLGLMLLTSLGSTVLSDTRDLTIRYFASLGAISVLAIVSTLLVQYQGQESQHGAHLQLHLVLLLSLLGSLLVQGLVVLRPALARIQGNISALLQAQQAVEAREEALRQEREMLDSVLELSPDHIYFKDRQSRFVRINLAHAKWFGLDDPSQAIGKLDSDFFTSEHANQALADEQAMMHTGQAISGKEEKETWPDGRVTWALTTKTLLRDRRGKVMGIMGVSRDITERKRFELELARNAEELARSNAELEQFAYVASHDLQEPLRMVASYTQLLARRYKGTLDAEADEFIGFAVDGATRMQGLIRDLLSYSRVTRQGKELLPTDSQAACRQAIENLRASIDESDAHVTVSSLPTVLADATQLTQLFQNLIGNAIKYRNERKPEVEVSAALRDGSWVFLVRDNGIGIEPEYFERIFHLFQRLHTRKQYSGTGIGLALCRKIVERHGGRIWLESQPGQGSTFHFSFPATERIQA